MSNPDALRTYSLNRTLCHGCGACAEVAPELFAMDPDTDMPVPLKDQGSEEAVRQAMAYCPNDAIEIEE